MNKEQQRIAIAKACGWTESTMSRRTCFDPSGLSTYWDNAPDYLNDLNAMHEAEGYLNTEDGTLGGFHNELMHVMDCKNASWRRVHATAAQRAEAFLRATNLWEES
jgi:hypothetical protein